MFNEFRKSYGFQLILSFNKLIQILIFTPFYKLFMETILIFVILKFVPMLKHHYFHNITLENYILPQLLINYQEQEAEIDFGLKEIIVFKSQLKFTQSQWLMSLRELFQLKLYLHIVYKVLQLFNNGLQMFNQTVHLHITGIFMTQSQ